MVRGSGERGVAPERGARRSWHQHATALTSGSQQRRRSWGGPSAVFSFATAASADGALERLAHACCKPARGPRHAEIGRGRCGGAEVLCVK
ncbi:hypothetical protein GN244_ATG14592 [Phytophthora infestans]|uniref:Uncharacterized protein n=1 Tax=Phytophthora infestans TaxID=4787 RepID=A0A833VY48_PHYIN|nr:hypothetical protein GN244_ATG14592 [Phytophthora infestans]